MQLRPCRSGCSCQGQKLKRKRGKMSKIKMIIFKATALMAGNRSRDAEGSIHNSHLVHFA